MPDNGLASLAGCLMAEGHEVRVQDHGTVETLERLFPARLRRRVRRLAEKMFVEGRKLSMLEKLRLVKAGMDLDAHMAREADVIAAEAAERAAELGADVVGLKLWNGDGFAGSVKIAQAVRRRLPGATIVGGGPQVDYFGAHILDYTDAFDALVAGDGERALPEFVRVAGNRSAWPGIGGLIWQDGDRVRRGSPRAIESLDELALPVYDPEVYPAAAGDGKIRVGVVDESRGCPNRCAFCIHPIKSGGKWCVKSPGRVTAEMRRLADSLHTRYFIYSGSNTSAHVAVGIAQEIVREGMDVRYGCFGHVRGIARADFDLLKQSGCEAIFYGLESGSARILRSAFDKPVNLDDARRVIRQTRQAGICAITSLIFPAPFEDADSRAETLALLREVRPDSVPVTIPGMIPGTPWEREPAKYGFEKIRRRDFWQYALTYKIRLLFPPSMWDPLPYRLNGKSSRRLFRECEDFCAEVERGGVPTNVPHELVLMADALGERDDLKGFRDRCRAMFMGGDVEGITEMVRRINANVAPGKRPARVETLGATPKEAGR